MSLLDKMMKIAGRDENGKARPISTDATGKIRTLIANTTPIGISGKDENGDIRAIKTDNKGTISVKTYQSNSQTNETITAVGNEEKKLLVNATVLTIANTDPYVSAIIRINGQKGIEIPPSKTLRIEAEMITTVDYISKLSPVKLILL